jgi:hypothetical protein
MGLTLLRVIPVWAWALAAALAWGAWQRHLAGNAVQALADQNLQLEKLRSEAMHAALVETTRRLSAQKEVTDVARQTAARNRQDAAAAAGSADRLRQHIARLATSAGACNSAAAPGGPAASAPAVVLADMLKRVESAGRSAAAGLDAATAAGIACERSYESLTRATP